MGNTDLVKFIKGTLSRIGIPCADVENEPSLVNGFCVLEGENTPYGFVIKVRDDCVASYLVAPYGEAAMAKPSFQDRIIRINLNLVKGNFNADIDAKKLMYKYVTCRSAVEGNEDAVRELVLLPAAMVKKYAEKFLE